MKVAEITDPSYRTGTGKKGPWTLIKIKTDSGVEATGFMPITVGDEVELVKNEQYGNYSFKKSEGSSIPSVDVNEDIKQSSKLNTGNFKLIYTELRAIHQDVKKLLENASMEPTDTVVEPTDEELNSEEGIDLSQIPF